MWNKIAEPDTCVTFIPQSQKEIFVYSKPENICCCILVHFIRRIGKHLSFWLIIFFKPSAGIWRPSATKRFDLPNRHKNERILPCSRNGTSYLTKFTCKNINNTKIWLSYSQTLKIKHFVIEKVSESRENVEQIYRKKLLASQ